MEQAFDIKDLKALKVELTRFMMAYKFALDEINTKINILKDEFNYIHEYNPIEHVKSRLKYGKTGAMYMNCTGTIFIMSGIDAPNRQS